MAQNGNIIEKMSISAVTLSSRLLIFQPFLSNFFNSIIYANTFENQGGLAPL